MTRSIRAQPPLPGPLAQLREGRLSRRLPQLVAGLCLYGFTMAMMVRSGLGLDPWDVLHEGLTKHIPLSFGQIVIVVGALVLLAWIPLRQTPGVGTLLNVVLVGLAADAGLAVLTRPEELWAQALFLAGGIVGNGFAGALYIGARLGTGPRDGLWVGLSRRTGLSPRLVRTVLELSLLGTGWILGGTVGLGTVLYALAIGPIVQACAPWCTVLPAGSAAPPPGPACRETQPVPEPEPEGGN